MAILPWLFTQAWQNISTISVHKLNEQPKYFVMQNYKKEGHIFWQIVKGISIAYG